MTGPDVLEWTGERCVPWAPDYQVIYEHYHRYLWASTLLSPGSRVLDLASGEGYGSDLLRSLGHHVTGVELDETAHRHAKATYPQVTFEQGDMTRLGAHLTGFDAVVCFEALEHVRAHDELVAGVRRALRPGGLFLVSTPDKDVYGGHSHQHGEDGEHLSTNPFHVRELNLTEFKALLEGSFHNSTVFAQRFAVGSLITPVAPQLTTDAGPLELVGLEAGGGGWQAAAPPPATYLLGLASDEPLRSGASDSVLLDGEITAVRSEMIKVLDLQGRVSDLEHELVRARRPVALRAAARVWPHLPETVQRQLRR